MKDNFKIPQTKAEKVALLYAISSGRKSIQDLKDEGYNITLHLDHDPAAEAERRRLKSIECKAKGKPEPIYITLNLNS